MLVISAVPFGYERLHIEMLGKLNKKKNWVHSVTYVALQVFLFQNYFYQLCLKPKNSGIILVSIALSVQEVLKFHTSNKR